MRQVVHLCSSACAFLLFIALARPATAQSLQTFVLAAGGQSDGMGTACTTFASLPPVSTWFLSAGVFVPIAGIPACSVNGGQRESNAVVGPLTDSYALSTNWNASANSLSATTDVRAQYRLIAAKAHVDYTGDSNPLMVKGSEGFAMSADLLTITSPSVANGQPGFLRVWVQVTGGLGTTGGSGTADVEVAYEIDGSNPWFLFRAQSTSPFSSPALFSATGNGLTGFLVAPGAVTGSGEVDTQQQPFVFGVPFDFRLAMVAFALPSLTSTTDVDFRAWISRIEVFDGSLQPVAATAVSASGTPYETTPRDFVLPTGVGGALPFFGTIRRLTAGH